MTIICIYVESSMFSKICIKNYFYQNYFYQNFDYFYQNDPNNVLNKNNNKMPYYTPNTVSNAFRLYYI